MVQRWSSAFVQKQVLISAGNMNQTKISAANKKYAKPFGWSPTDFGLETGDFSVRLTEAVKLFQKEWALSADGICGPTSSSRLDISKISCNQQTNFDFLDQLDVIESDSILVGGKRLPMLWPHVSTPDEEGAPVLTGGYSKNKKRTGKGAVIHWPCTYTPAQTLRVLNARNVGTHFEIGPPIGESAKVTIYQYADTDKRTWHATTANHFVGIDITSPVYAKKRILEKLERLGHSKRPIITNLNINGFKPGPIIGYHDNQINALTALLAALHVHCGVALEAPAFTGNWRNIQRVANKAAITSGVYHHAEVDYPVKRKDGKIRPQGKWDTAGLDLKTITDNAKLLALNMLKV